MAESIPVRWGGLADHAACDTSIAGFRARAETAEATLARVRAVLLEGGQDAESVRRRALAITGSAGRARPVPEEWIDAALAADLEWMRSARAVVFVSPARDQVRAMLEAAAPLIAAAERERIREMAVRNGAVCPGDDGTSCYFAALLEGPGTPVKTGERSDEKGRRS